jgi:hypothetical protein
MKADGTDGRWLAYSSGALLPPPEPDPENPFPPEPTWHAKDPQIWLMTAAGTRPQCRLPDPSGGGAPRSRPPLYGKTYAS